VPFITLQIKERGAHCPSSAASDASASPSLAKSCEQARLKALAAAQSEPSYSSDPVSRADAIVFLESDLAKLAYFGQPAPAIDVVWTSEPGVRSFEDVRGKVVVLEFWAVTCGPCIANIPKMEQLKQDVAGEPVAFIAVTGAVQEDLSEPKLPTPEQTAVAAAALKKFMAKKRMTGTVWASAAGSFDPSFGIKSIPHIVVLDAQGRVRASDLHPADPDAIRRQIVLATKPLKAKP
jgi:thiol-disulfide isomerase/thioredoxin